MKFSGRIVQIRYAREVVAISPTFEGVRAAFRCPAVSLAEVIWRWSVAATAIALMFFGIFEYFAALPVTGGEILLLRTRQPILVAQAIAHILRGGWSRAMSAVLPAALALALLWMIVASLGRMATLAALLGYFRRDVSTTPENDAAHERSRSTTTFRTLFRLRFLRMAVAVAAISGLVGAGVLAGLVSASAGSAPLVSMFVFVFVAALVSLVWWILNWILSLAAVFAVRDDRDALAAVSAAVSLCRERAAAVVAVSFWTALVHLAAFVAATSIVFLPLALAGTFSWRVIVCAMTLITLAYFAVVDWIYIARLAGYVCIAEMPDALSRPQTSDLAPRSGMSSAPVPSSVTAVDRDELILSDLPALAAET